MMNEVTGKMLWFSIKGDDEHWWHETTEKKVCVRF